MQRHFGLLVLVVATVTWPGFAFAADEDEAAVASAPASQPAGIVVEGIVVNYLGAGVNEAVARIESPDAAAGTPAVAEGKTNQLGQLAIRLAKPLEGKFRVRVHKEGYTDYVGEIEFVEGEDLPFIDVTLSGSAEITGVVRTFATSQPVSDALVECENGGRQQQVQTDAEGKYRFGELVRGGVEVAVTAKGFGVERREAEIKDGATRLDVELRPERTIELMIVTREGTPADRVLVEAVTEPAYTSLNAMSDKRGAAVLHGVPGDAERVRLRLNGEGYVLMGDYAESVQLATSQPASGPVGDPRAIVRQRLVVTRSAAIRGRVVDAANGQPVIGVRVIAGREAYGRMPMMWTSLDGTYELGGLPPGLNVISLQHPDHATLIREVQLTAGQTAPVDAKLEAGQPIAGRVLDEARKPAAEVWVTAEDWNGYATLGMRTVSDAAGHFEFPHAPAGQITVSFAKPGYGKRRETLAAGRSDYEIKLEGVVAATQPEGGKLKIGDAVPELVMTGPDGKVLKSSELAGKYVFLDCWASWCGPCMGEMPNVKALRAATKDRKDFLLIGINLDSQPAACAAAVKRVGIDWLQISGPKSGAEEVFAVLDGFGIPYTCLIGPDGKLLAQHLRGPGIVDEVKKLLK
jgi:thiol-disulfide isomerase/thioredoxin